MSVRERFWLALVVAVLMVCAASVATADSILITDSYSPEIYKYDLETGIGGTFATLALDAGDSAGGIVYNPVDGKVYVSTWNGKIWRFNVDGSGGTLFFSTPQNIYYSATLTVGSDGTVYNVDAARRKVVKYDSAGNETEYSASMGTEARFRQMSMGPDGNIYLACNDTSSVLRVLTDGTVETWATLPSDSDVNGLGFSNAGNLSVMTRKLWWSNYNKIENYGFSPTGAAEYIDYRLTFNLYKIGDLIYSPDDSHLYQLGQTLLVDCITETNVKDYVFERIGAFFLDMTVVPYAPPASKIYYDDEVNVDGDVSEWGVDDWRPFDKVYDGNPVDVSDGSAWAARWGDGGTRIYVAVKVRDTDHVFTDTYQEYDARDAVELYINTTGTDTGPYGDNNYETYQEQAQEWSVGIKNSDNTSVWTAVGYWPDPNNQYTPLPDEFMAKGRVVDDWLYYEAAITPYEYFGKLRGNPNIVSPLFAGDLVRTDATIVAHATTGYTGMKSSGHIDGGQWFRYYMRLAQHELLRTGVKGTITLQDFGASTLGADAQIVITDAGSGSETHNVVLDGSGNYTFKTALSGNCTAVASATGYASQSASVTVTNGEGEVSFVLTRQTLDASITDAKKQAPGSLVSITGSITAVFNSCIYIESSDRSSGIRIDKAAHGFINSDIGKIVTVTGAVAKDSVTDEVYVDADIIGTTTETEVLQPLGMTNKSLGGGDMMDTGGNGQVGVDQGTGLNNIGLLVRTTGLVSDGDANGFTLTDGSGVVLRVSLAGVGAAYDGQYVTVTGISCIGSGGVRIIKARTAGDVESVN